MQKTEQFLRENSSVNLKVNLTDVHCVGDLQMFLGDAF